MYSPGSSSTVAVSVPSETISVPPTSSPSEFSILTSWGTDVFDAAAPFGFLAAFGRFFLGARTAAGGFFARGAGAGAAAAASDERKGGQGQGQQGYELLHGGPFPRGLG